MKKVVLGILAALAVVVLGFVAYVSTLPSHSHVERTKLVHATPADVWPYVGDLRRFIDWSPWQGIDPNQQMEFSDPSSGVGAWYTWSGNEEVGTGKMTIVGSEPDEKLTETLEFIEPFASKADVVFKLDDVAAGTKLTWGFDMDNNFMSKAFGVFMDMDAAVGADFERGLDNLATLAEADAKARVAGEKAAEAQAATPTKGDPAQATETTPAAP
jgi:hypothetical protein